MEEPAEVPVAARVMGLVVTMLVLTVISNLFNRKISRIKNWRNVPYAIWLTLALYVDSYLFVFAVGIMQHAVGTNVSLEVCSAAILVCLGCYLSTKLLLYLFLTERAHVVRGMIKRRLDSKLYIFNFVTLTLGYIGISILLYLHRIARFDDGQCVIGMERFSIIPFLVFGTIVDIYLSILFFIPFRTLYQFRDINPTPASKRLRGIALRSFIGGFAVLTTSVVNGLVMIIMEGQQGWICLLLCCIDLAFASCMVHWITMKDDSKPKSSTLESTSLGPSTFTS